MSDGWAQSAAAWIDHLGEEGDFGRVHVLDQPMLALVRARHVVDAIDVGCGEGRFCRMLANEGIRSVGIDPTSALIDRARALHPAGDYRLGAAEKLDFADHSFDLVCSYLSLIDITDIDLATAEMARVLRPGGSLLIANLTSFNTAGQPDSWKRDLLGRARFSIDHYLEERVTWAAWKGIRVANWHRPLSTYMKLLIDQGLVLRHFDEPSPTGGDPARGARFRRVPYFVMMEWGKPAA